jgi:hypothetical protein
MEASRGLAGGCDRREAPVLHSGESPRDVRFSRPVPSGRELSDPPSTCFHDAVELAAIVARKSCSSPSTWELCGKGSWTCSLSRSRRLIWLAAAWTSSSRSSRNACARSAPSGRGRTSRGGAAAHEEVSPSRGVDAHVADVVRDPPRDLDARGSCRAEYDDHARRHATSWPTSRPGRCHAACGYAASSNEPIVAARGVRVQIPPPTLSWTQKPWSEGCGGVRDRFPTGPQSRRACVGVWRGRRSGFSDTSFLGRGCSRGRGGRNRNPGSSHVDHPTSRSAVVNRL